MLVVWCSDISRFIEGGKEWSWIRTQSLSQYITIKMCSIVYGTQVKRVRVQCSFIYCTLKNLQTCVVTPPAGLWCVAAAAEVVQTQHVSSAPWPVSAAVLDVSIILRRAIKAGLLPR